MQSKLRTSWVAVSVLAVEIGRETRLALRKDLVVPFHVDIRLLRTLLNLPINKSMV